MVDQEVESILSEIRQRVLSEQRPGQTTSGLASSYAVGNGASDSALSSRKKSETPTPEALSLIKSYLTTTARAWDRLPPVASNRSGASARLELWVKRHLKRATRWYAWEQVNFNAAVHHALRDIVEVLSAQARELESLRTTIGLEAQAHEKQWEKRDTELRALHVRIDIQRAEIEGQSSHLEQIEKHEVEVTKQLSAVVGELREGDERLRDEQRVCFKQLSVETSEAAVLEDRARRKTEMLLEELSRRMEALERRKR